MSTTLPTTLTGENINWNRKDTLYNSDKYQVSSDYAESTVKIRFVREQSL